MTKIRDQAGSGERIGARRKNVHLLCEEVPSYGKKKSVAYARKEQGKS